MGAVASLGIILAYCVCEQCTFTERYPRGGARGRFPDEGGRVASGTGYKQRIYAVNLIASRVSLVLSLLRVSR